VAPRLDHFTHHMLLCDANLFWFSHFLDREKHSQRTDQHRAAPPLVVVFNILCLRQLSRFSLSHRPSA